MKLREPEELRIVKILEPSDVREVCINYNWFTRGSNEIYADLLEYVGKRNITAERLRVIAEEIKDFSYTDYSVTEIMGILCCQIQCRLMSKDDAKRHWKR